MKRLLLAGMFWFAPVMGLHVYAHDFANPGAPAAANKPVAAAPSAGAPAGLHAGHNAANSSNAAASLQPDYAAHEAGTVADNESSEHQAGGMTMLHAGLPGSWILSAAIAMFAIALRSLCARLPKEAPERSINLATLSLVGPLVRFLNRSPYPLLAGKLVAVALYLLLIAAGLFGTPYPERNLATVLVWNVWWPLVVVSVFFLGTAWCAVCPWDALSSWLVRRHWWRRASPHPGLNLRVPRYLHNVWLALLLFIGLTWLEIGMGVTSIPYATALMALVMFVMSAVFLVVFERKAFCRYACPVGRTLGFYARLAPLAVRPVEQETCDRCTSLECYRGSALIEPCPTNLVVGRFSQNTFCISCGNCALSCPHQNVSWRLRSIASEASDQARPQWDGAWFMLGLLGITSFHGLTMMPFWGEWVAAIGGVIGESGKPFISFTLAMIGGFALPVLIYAAAVGGVRLAAPRRVSYKSLFAVFSFAALPLAFAYHLAHNMDHLMRETGDLLASLLNPLGIGAEPLSMAERHAQMMAPLFPDGVMFTVQCALMVLGFWLAAQIARHRGRALSVNGVDLTGWRLLPLLAFIGAITAVNLWLMAHDMEMRF
jgi:polyferredoxin